MEIVLGVKRELLHGILVTDFGYIDNQDYSIIINNLSSEPRDLAETNPQFKQIIPYLFITHNSQYLLYNRTKAQTERRLHNKLSLGIGGHINPIDNIEAGNTIVQCLERELEEEVSIELVGNPDFLGFINDEQSEVGRVHLGMVFRGQAKSQSFTINEPDKMTCRWADKSTIANNYKALESWSQIVFDSLIR
ncbi:NUDIX domain-containing protein [Parapedobacter sp. 2B3]|uniref:NUDIX domain-containing protein n=1 Tax=Parapedobacter sp. 2B3 TaxID=3342381 RepID=UPI0035B69CD8